MLARLASIMAPLMLSVMAVMLTAGCAARAPSVPLGQDSFSRYSEETRQFIAAHRHFQTDDHAAEVGFNAPFERRPATTPRKGIVLVHGLGDSPWSFVDIADVLARQGFLVRTVLLAGHGTQPADMMHVDLADWQRVVREQVALMKRDVPDVYLGGFSTGANLVTSYAMDDKEIRGLLLYSPAFRSNQSMDWVMPWVAPFKPWLREPDANREQQTPVRYLNVPSNGFAQFYRSSAAVRDAIGQREFDRPVLMVMTEHDSVVDVGYVRQQFRDRFPNAASRLIWYGHAPAGEAGEVDPRVLVRSDSLPAERISRFSHMGILFSPANPLYGRSGTQRLCWNGQAEAEFAQCRDGGEVWYSDWGYREGGKAHARLTWNPYFDWQAGVMRGVLDAALRGQQPAAEAEALRAKLP
jgi:esterase/lipase